MVTKRLRAASLHHLPAVPPTAVGPRWDTPEATLGTGRGPVYTQALFLQAPFLELLELLLGASSLGDLEDVEPHSLAEGTTLAHSDDVPDLDVPATTPRNFSGSGVAPLAVDT